ncbi:MAG: hypothetical protein LQ340_007990, partial [Diploschistes diacapsis]
GKEGIICFRSEGGLAQTKTHPQSSGFLAIAHHPELPEGSVGAANWVEDAAKVLQSNLDQAETGRRQ